MSFIETGRREGARAAPSRFPGSAGGEQTLERPEVVGPRTQGREKTGRQASEARRAVRGAEKGAPHVTGVPNSAGGRHLERLGQHNRHMVRRGGGARRAAAPDGPRVSRPRPRRRILSSGSGPACRQGRRGEVRAERGLLAGVHGKQRRARLPTRARLTNCAADRPSRRRPSRSGAAAARATGKQRRVPARCSCALTLSGSPRRVLYQGKRSRHKENVRCGQPAKSVSCLFEKEAGSSAEGARRTGSSGVRGTTTGKWKGRECSAAAGGNSPA
jgi:hypothetical protein